MKITKDFPGLVDIGWAYELKGSLVVDGGLDIQLGGKCLKVEKNIEAGCGIEAGEGIEAGCGIKAGWGIEAGEGIKAGWSIEAGEGIEAGLGIKAGWSIICTVLTCRYRIFAGLCIWKIPSKEEKQIICEKVASGEIAYGELVIKKGTK